MLAAIIALASAVAAAITPAEQAAVRKASARGALMYAYDQAAWHGSDDMIAKVPDYRERMGGYVVDGTVDATRLVFFDKAGTRAVYVAHFTAGRLIDSEVIGPGDDATLSSLDHTMIAARAAASRALMADKSVFACGNKPFNTVVLPPETPGDPVNVYFLSPQVTNDAIPLGGHYRVQVDAEGHAGAPHAFSFSCIAAPTHPKLPKGAPPSMFVITGLTDPIPTEVHVFASMALHLPVGVGTPGPPARLWPVSGATIGEPVLLKR